jgi:ubiquinone/menaquinone biosynthesis C-methylase UbiE
MERREQPPTGKDMRMTEDKDYFDSVSKQWDEMRRSFFSDALRDKALAIAGVERGARAADIGAGTGFFTEALVSRGVSVIAVDQSEGMLQEMRRKFAGVEGIEYRVGDAEHLPIPNEEVGHVLANMYLHHVERPGAAIAEMARILAPGGTLVITDLDEHEFEFLKTEQHDRWMGFKREHVARWLEEAGLREVTVVCAAEDCCTQSPDGNTIAISIFIASGRK